MADVSRGSDRGQLFIVGALALSVLLVTLAVLLNTAIYTGNIATRDTGPGTGDVVQYEGAAKSAAGELLTAVNYANDTSYPALRSNFTAAMANWTEAATMHTTIRGADGHTESVATTTGTRIVQDTQRNFTNKSNAAAWTVATNTTVRNYTMTVRRGGLASAADTLLANRFTLTVTGDSGASYTVFVYHETRVSGEYIVVEVEAPGGSTSECAVEQEQAVVDVTNASVGGGHCPALAFFGALQAPYDLVYEKAGKIDGTYSLVVGETHDTVLASGHYYDSAGSGDPYVTYALYSADLRVTYRSPTTYYQTQVRIAPGEPDA